MGYLTYIAEYYDCLPKVTLFAHPHCKSHWHSNEDLDYNVERIQWDNIKGFAAVHSHGMWFDTYLQNTTKNLIGNELSEEEARLEQRKYGDCDGLLNGTAYKVNDQTRFWRGEWIARAWDTYLGAAGLGDIMVQTRCSVSAEFFVTKERIQRHPREFYLKLIHWAANSEKISNLNAYEVACVLENLWHYIFGEPAYQEKLSMEECTLYSC